MTIEVYRMIREALEHADKLSDMDGTWATLEVNHTETERPVVAVHYGSILSNGMREARIGTRSYHVGVDGIVYSTINVHP